MEKFIKKYGAESFDDNTGEYYDNKPVDCDGFLTHHARKQSKKRNVSKKDMILGKSCANTMEKDGIIITVLGNNIESLKYYKKQYEKNKKLNNLKPGQRILKCDNCNINYKSTYKGKNPLCMKCSQQILIERVCSTCDKKYKTKFTGDNPKCYSCVQQIKEQKELDKIKKIQDKEKEIPLPCEIHEWKCLDERVHNKGDGRGKYQNFTCIKCNKWQKRYIKKTNNKKKNKNKM